MNEPPQGENIWPPAPVGLNEDQPVRTNPRYAVLNALEFNHTSTWLVFFGTISTLGIYSYFWFYLVAKKLRELRRANSMEPMVFPLMLLIYLVSGVTTRVLVYLETITPETEHIIDRLIQLPVSIIVLICRFKLRNQFDYLFQSDATRKYKMGGLGTFFLGPIYMNYQKNRAIDAARALDNR